MWSQREYDVFKLIQLIEIGTGIDTCKTCGNDGENKQHNKRKNSGNPGNEFH